MTTESYPTPLRILCLHDGNSSAEKLHEKLKNLDRRLYRNHQVELVYVDSPLRTDEEGSSMWWEKQAGNEELCFGLDASLLHVRQVLGKMPFSGILGVGQGAGMSSLLQLMGIELEFGIFVHGHALLEEMEGRDDWPVLHICDPDFEPSRRLIERFGGIVHESKAEPLCNADLNAIGKFVVQQKKRLHRNARKELVLQNQLHVVEQEAAQLVAQMVSENPPKALMAIISPQRLGAWSGDKPQKPGGGAPCPSEFLLRKEARIDEGGQIGNNQMTHKSDKTIGHSETVR